MGKNTARSSGEEQRLQACAKEGSSPEVQLLGGPPNSELPAGVAISPDAGVAPVQADYGAIHTAILESLIVILAGKEGEPFQLDELLSELEKGAIQIAMAATGDIGKQAAWVLGINRSTLVMKRRRLGLPMKARRVKGAEGE
jgi:DNA-binding protein Fis